MSVKWNFVLLKEFVLLEKWIPVYKIYTIKGPKLELLIISATAQDHLERGNVIVHCLYWSLHKNHMALG